MFNAFTDHEANFSLGLPHESISPRLGVAQPAADCLLSRLRPSADAVGDQVAELTHNTSRSALVSCIMLTRNRPDFALQAIRYFQCQDYPNIELILIANGTAPLSQFLPRDPRLRLLCPSSSMSNDSLTNLACQKARGEIIIHWNDLDWYGSRGISRQVSAVQAGLADATVLFDPIVLDLSDWQFGRLGYRLPRELLLEILASTLALKRSLWQRLAYYPDNSCVAPVSYLKQILRRGARLQSIRADGVLIRLHRPNACKGIKYRTIAARHPVVEPRLPAADRAFYVRKSSAAPPAPVVPLISCIMPTRDRRRFVERAIKYFDRQDYPFKELIIVDDGHDPVADLAAGCSGVRYYSYHHRIVLGTKRNIACELAEGEFIAHLDDDDWYACSHLSVLIGSLLRSRADVGGVRALPFIDVETGKAWLYEWPASKRIWAAGNSLGYRKDLWLQSRFPNLNKAEDTAFVWNAAVRSMCDISDADTVVGTIHTGNTVPKRVHGTHWRPMPLAELKRLLGGDFQFYRNINNTIGE